jgi:transcriptional regulator with XRE-family HTH domain
MARAKSPVQVSIDWKAVGRRIRELRGFDTKQSEVAAAIGVAQSLISAVEHGQREIGVVVLYRIALYYDKTIEWLLTGGDHRA